MNLESAISIRIAKILAIISLAVMSIAIALPTGAAQPPAKPAAGVQLDASAGTKATYRVREQLLGIDFPDDAIGSTDAVTGSVVLAPDGSVDTTKSKLTIDLRTLKSDQDARDNAIKTRVFETDKFPTAEFVPKKLTGIPIPMPAPDRASEQDGFKLVGDLTVHGVTKEVTLIGYTTISKDLVAGHATTDFTFDTFGLTKPKIARIVTIDDKIQLEIDFKFKRS